MKKVKGILVVLAMVGTLCLLVWIGSNTNPADVDDLLPKTRYSNGYQIRTIEGQDFIVTHDANSGERLTPLVKPPTTPPAE